MKMKGQQGREKRLAKKTRFQVVRLEDRIAPSVIGTGGYDGRPGNQSSAPHNPSGSANPENSAS